MIYRKCECGKAESWESGMPPADCSGCEECGTTYATNPEGHKPLAPHDWSMRYDVRTGKPDGRICERCYKREKITDEAPAEA